MYTLSLNVIIMMRGDSFLYYIMFTSSLLHFLTIMYKLNVRSYLSYTVHALGGGAGLA